ncbi:hypothetical protein GCM10010965_04410 [Caldalkalibacillus thermarum]|uniref:hypothetical protein n=1 Tax=Caldalkalibacillus thermarum TaxID=296745 RepID=UPI0016652DC8|nr:hypothetical protein [Caldalkalibacillus thermarum]GGK14478.1 hypothetical protein GCM10010965_04410 [Caldalkalibacillus thermarum]
MVQYIGCHVSIAKEDQIIRRRRCSILNAFKGNQTKVDYAIIPHTVFTIPQVATVGLTEEGLILMAQQAVRELDTQSVPK